MLFLLRLAFWILLICLLLPGSHEDNRHLINSAERTVNDVRGFCQRNPEVCEDARISLTLMLSRLRNGAELVQTWLAQYKKETDDTSTLPPAPAQSQPSPAQPPRLLPKWQDSLNPADKQVPWQGPARL
jgi:Family of unknown function (DUF5330)